MLRRLLAWCLASSLLVVAFATPRAQTTATPITAKPNYELAADWTAEKVRRLVFDTTVTPDPSSPTDALGLPTGYIKSPAFGTADRNRDYPVPFTGLTGGRTFRFAVGIRF